jgi:hypothetical protein
MAMNSLSWLLYVADLADKIIPIFFILGFVILIGWFGTWIIRSVESYDDGSHRPPLWILVPAFILILVACFVPTRTTVMLIAASEIGEEVAMNPEVQGVGRDALDLIRDKLQEWKAE